MNIEDSKVVQSLLNVPQKIVIIPHKNPDGDAVGSTLGLMHYLKNRGQDAIVIAPNDFPKFLKWMPGQEEIIIFENNKDLAEKHITEASLIFTLDFNNLSRVGFMQESLEAATGTFIMIDHHQAPSDYAKVTYSDVHMSSTCEMVYNFIEAVENTSKITVDIANCLYAGIMTDTGSFKYSSTTSRTHRVVADLIDKGAENMVIHNKVFDTNSPSRLHILGCALKNMVILQDYHTAYITLSQEELDKNGFKKGDTEGIVNYGLTLNNIIFAVIFIENKDEGIIKISFRSQGDFSVNEFARTNFEGGGHDNAAGGKSDTSLQETTAKFVALLDSYKDQLKG